MIDCPAAVEAVAVIIRMSGWAASAAPASRPKPGASFSTPGGKPRVGETLHDPAIASGVSVRRLGDDRATGRQRRSDLPGVDVDRIVPRRDGADHADRRGNNEAADVRERAEARIEPPIRRPSSA